MELEASWLGTVVRWTLASSLQYVGGSVRMCVDQVGREAE